jgi:hypothetical protein
MSSQQKSATVVSHFKTINRTAMSALLLASILLAGTLCPAANRASSSPLVCNSGSLPTGGDGTQDVQVVGPGICTVGPGTYYYHNFNIYNGGTLEFIDSGNIDLWAANILVENSSSLIAGSPSAPYGVNGILTIHLWGPAQQTGTGKGDGGVGITCLSDQVNQCGVPTPLWNSNPSMGLNPTSCVLAINVPGFNQNLPGNVNDCFYAYMPLDYDDGGTPPGYFGYKVLGVSYGGTLQLFGKKGATYSTLTPANSGTSWARLNRSVKKSDTTLVLDRTVDWAANDQVVLTTTDYLPAHSEQLTIQSVSTSGGVTTLTLTSSVQYTHNGRTYDYGLKKVPTDIGPDQDPNVTCSAGQTRCVETRAAVGLLTRSVRIVSAGDTYNAPFPASSTGYYFGGHMIARQGFLSVQIQGVEFYQMGEGGRIMHYPVHFHMARQTPANTYVADSTVYDSMTRWYTIHATQGVTLARNVGFLSIGHGYYLEDGSETGNKLYANLGVLARAGVTNPQNPRNVPGIFAAEHQNSAADEVPFHTDFDHPTTFWITNGYNDFEYNVAAGAGTCGMCYWLLPATNSGDSRYEYWNSYSGEQQYLKNPTTGVDELNQAGITPLYKFVGNSCTTAQNSFSTIGNSTGCNLAPTPGAPLYLQPIINPLSPAFPADPTTQAFSPQADAYYPKVAGSGYRQATQCPATGSCATVTPCAYNSTSNQAPPNCMITDIDHYTTSFNWAQTNYGAIWLRSQWYLFTNSAVTDVQGAGLTFISGGGYTGSDHIPGYWALAHKNVFVGSTQPTNPFTSPAGPFNPNSGLVCDAGLPAAVCSSVAQGVAIPLDNFGAGERMFSIYDGPAYQSANAYLDINKTVLNGCTPGNGAGGGNCTGWMFWRTLGVPLDPTAASGEQCYMPNAAIAWKQSNGFYYPPAFHSNKLFFNNVDIRHFVIEPLFQPNTFTTDLNKAQARYCIYQSDMFSNFTDIDRQTELSDDDGSLTGLLGPVDLKSKTYDPAISINKDRFFNVPVETAQCASDIPKLMQQGANCPYAKQGYPDLCATANTSPYEYVTTVVFPDCGVTGTCDLTGGNWGIDCEDQSCYGVPLYREDTNPGEQGASQIRMMADSTYQRSNLTVNHGLFYIDTTVSNAIQSQQGANTNVFVGGQTYYVFQLFAKPDTSVTYQIYVGKDFDPSTQLAPLRVNQLNNPPTFTPGPWGSYPCPQGGCFDSSTGILTIPLDMSLFSYFKANYNAAKQDECAPATFCTWNSQTSTCGCNPSQTSASPTECQNACANWSTKDVDCPQGGCYGFAVTLPGDFVAGTPAVAPPQVACFPKDNNWNIKFSNPTQNPGSCLYAGILPTGQFCGTYVNWLLREGPSVAELGMRH